MFMLSHPLSWIILILSVSYSASLDCSCDFETSLCGWYGRPSRNLKWERGRAGSVVAGTGPPADRTLQSAAGYYAKVLFASQLGSPETIKLRSPKMSDFMPTGRCTMEFEYNMYSPSAAYCYNSIGDSKCSAQALNSGMIVADYCTANKIYLAGKCDRMCGTNCAHLKVYVTNDLTKKGTLVFEQIHPKDDTWHPVPAPIDLVPFYSQDLWVTFEVTSGADAPSYVALDEVRFYHCQFYTSTVAPSTVPVSGPTVVSQSRTCQFDSGMCGWSSTSSNVALDWKRSLVGNPSQGTGPIKDVSTTGYFAYVPIVSGGGYKTTPDVTTFISPAYTGFPQLPTCEFSFSYSIYSDQMVHCKNVMGDAQCASAAQRSPGFCTGTFKGWAATNCAKFCGEKCFHLKLYVTNNKNNVGSPLFVKLRQTDEKWHRETVNISALTGRPFWVVFEGMTGMDDPGYIALDAFEFSGCDIPTTTTAYVPTTTTTAATTTATTTATRTTTTTATTAAIAPQSSSGPTATPIQKFGTPSLVINTPAPQEDGVAWPLVAGIPASILAAGGILVGVGLFMVSRIDAVSGVGDGGNGSKVSPDRRSDQDVILEEDEEA